jgi:hypothetical protein
MSKQNNINPGVYYDGDRNHQGEGIVHEEHKSKMNEQQRQSEGKEGERNFIPGEKPVGEKSGDSE